MMYIDHATLQQDTTTRHCTDQLDPLLLAHLQLAVTLICQGAADSAMHLVLHVIDIADDTTITGQRISTAARKLLGCALEPLPYCTSPRRQAWYH